MYGDREREITGIACDSRAVQPGNLFVAVRGGRFDGADFIEAAVEKGAVSVLYGKDPARTEKYETLRSRFPGVAWIAVNDCRDALAYVSNILYRRPSEECLVIGITGTNGKTTTSYLIKDIVERGGGSAGLIGTISYLIKGKTYDAPHTTPEAPDFQKLLRAMVEEGCSHVISEVSSHALAQKRVEYTRFRVGVFTNLTRDHLDFHLTMEEYYRAKERLFTELVEGSGAAVINTDDPYGKRLADMLRERRAGMRVLTFGIEDGGADVVAYEIKATFKGTAFKVRIREQGVGAGEDGEESTGIPAHRASSREMVEELSTPLVGYTNVYNVLSAVCVALSLHIPIRVIKEGVSMAGLVKGRFEKVDLGQDFLAVVDYAHTEDALERLLMTSRQLLEAYRFAERTDRMMRVKKRQFSLPGGGERGTEAETGKIITVIGCGGNRDKGKRSKMGEIASKLSDFVIVTSDNPRNEDPRAIIRDIEKGIKNDNYIVIPDRSVAISMAVELASSGDIVLVAGKGHEDYQEIQGVRHRFSDRIALEDAIKRTTSRAFRGDSPVKGARRPDRNCTL